MLNKLTKRRLLKAVEYMRSLPKWTHKHFDMTSYFSHYGEDEHRFGDTLTTKDMHACGTTACAAGWLGTSPYFRRIGLTTSPDDNIRWKGRKVDYMAMTALFPGLAHYDLESLFGASNIDRNPREWARRVEALVKRWDRRSD